MKLWSIMSGFRRADLLLHMVGIVARDTLCVIACAVVGYFLLCLVPLGFHALDQIGGTLFCYLPHLVVVREVVR